jgi:hypothetical protein
MFNFKSHSLLVLLLLGALPAGAAAPRQRSFGLKESALLGAGVTVGMLVKHFLFPSKPKVEVREVEKEVFVDRPVEEVLTADGFAQTDENEELRELKLAQVRDTLELREALERAEKALAQTQLTGYFSTMERVARKEKAHQLRRGFQAFKDHAQATRLQELTARFDTEMDAQQAALLEKLELVKGRLAGIETDVARALPPVKALVERLQTEVQRLSTALGTEAAARRLAETTAQETMDREAAAKEEASTVQEELLAKIEQLKLEVAELTQEARQMEIARQRYELVMKRKCFDGFVQNLRLAREEARKTALAQELSNRHTLARTFGAWAKLPETNRAETRRTAQLSAIATRTEAKLLSSVFATWRAQIAAARTATETDAVLPEDSPSAEALVLAAKEEEARLRELELATAAEAATEPSEEKVAEATRKAALAERMSRLSTGGTPVVDPTSVRLKSCVRRRESSVGIRHAKMAALQGLVEQARDNFEKTTEETLAPLVEYKAERGAPTREIDSFMAAFQKAKKPGSNGIAKRLLGIQAGTLLSKLV